MEVSLMGWGDEIMAAGHARKAQQADSRKVCILDKNARPRAHEMWLNNPRITQEQGEHVNCIVNGPNVRPYIVKKTYANWTWRAGTCERGEIYFSEEERRFAAALHGDYIVIEPNVKAAAPPNKDWGWQHWLELAQALQLRGVRMVQFGTVAARRIAGVEFVQTPTFRHACAALSVARAAVLPEGGMHHAAAALGIKAVVIFGSYISPEVTGYAEHENIFVGAGLGCGCRQACEHSRKAMGKITSRLVLNHLEKIL